MDFRSCCDGRRRIRRASQPPLPRSGFASSSFLDGFRFQFYFSVDDIDPESDDIDVIPLAHGLALLFDHRAKLFEGDVRRLAELLVFLFDLIVQVADRLAVCPRHQLYIRIGVGRRYARGGRAGRGRCLRRFFERRLAPAKIDRTFFALAYLSAPHFAVLVEPAEELVVSETPRVLAHLLLAQLVDVDLNEVPLMLRRHLHAAHEKHLVLHLQLADVFLELVELRVLFDHGQRIQYAHLRDSSSRRSIPSVERILSSAAFASVIAEFSRARVKDGLTAYLDGLRTAAGAFEEKSAADAVRLSLQSAVASTLRRVINGSGIIIHTNLGRAPIDAGLWERAGEIAENYSNLEFDLDAGERG